MERKAHTPEQIAIRGQALTSSDLDHFEKNGWVVLELPNPEPVHAAREAILGELRKLLGSRQVTLENYHEYVQDDEQHTAVQHALTCLFRDRRFGQGIIAAQLDLFRELFGHDLNVAHRPYLRVTRPGKPQDNTGYHRGTFYTEWGGHFEFPVWVPYTDAPAGTGLYAVPGSHVRAESEVPHRRVESLEVKKGSIKHQMGFSYAPKIIEDKCLVDLQPVPVALGEAMVFQHTLVHGTVKNSGTTSRWSSDTRVINAWAPIDLKLRRDYYEDLCRSAAFRMIRRYEQRNGAAP